MAAYIPCPRENNTGRSSVDPRNSSAYRPDNWQCPRSNGSGQVNVNPRDWSAYRPNNWQNPRPQSHRGRGNRRWRRRGPQRNRDTQQANVSYSLPVNNNQCHWQSQPNSGNSENNSRQPQNPFWNSNVTRSSQNQHQQKNRGNNSSYHIQGNMDSNSNYVHGNIGSNQGGQPTAEERRRPVINTGMYVTASMLQATTTSATNSWRAPNVAGINPSQRQPLFTNSGTNLAAAVSNLNSTNNTANSNPPFVYPDEETLNQMLLNLTTTDTNSNPNAVSLTLAPNTSPAPTNAHVSVASTTAPPNLTSTNFNQGVSISMAKNVDENKSASTSTTEDGNSQQSGTSLNTDVTSADLSQTKSTTYSIVSLTSNQTATFLQASALTVNQTEANIIRDENVTIANGLKSSASLTAIDEQVEFRNYVDRNLPSYWVGRSEVTSNDNAVRNANLFVKVDNRTREAITNLVTSTWDRGHVGWGQDARGLKHSSIQMVSVQRIENKNLFYAYDFERKRMRSLGGPCTPVGQVQGSKGDVLTRRYLAPFMRDQLYDNINEHYLFHGTDPKLVNAIASNGLDPRISHSQNMLGTAIHFAEFSTKSDQYTDRSNSRRSNTDIHTMFLVRVLLGEVFRLDKDHVTLKKGNKRLVRPPCIVCLNDFCDCPNQQLYGSVMADGHWIFREFGIYDKNLCYPEYLIEYRRV